MNKQYEKIKRLGLALLLSLTANITVLAQTNTLKHEVQTGETLYSLSRRYGVSVDDIRNANPQMGEFLLTGQEIVIPAAKQQGSASTIHAGLCKRMHLVDKKETIYSLARQFDLTEDELLAANPQIKNAKLKKGEYICIPYSSKEIADKEEQRRLEKEAEILIKEEEERQAQLFDKINVAVILPFALDTDKKNNEAIKMVDFYEGFLLAIDDLKSRGIDMDIYAYEEKTGFASNIDSILASPMMPHMNLIVGPMKAENIPVVNQFAKRHNIVVAVPFSSRTSITTGMPNVFQVNTGTALLYNKVYEQFIAHNQNAHVVFINSADKNEKPDFISGFKAALSEKEMEYSSVELGELSNLQNIITTDKKYIFVPSSSSQSAFENMVKKLNVNTNLADYTFSFFGYPEWQTFNEKNKQNMNKYHASFFATFYTNPNTSEVQAFNRKFNYWFKREQFNSYPLYGLLGYDIAQYFIAGLYAYGKGFADNQMNMSIPALQNPMRFEQENSRQGFINTYVRIISL